MSEYSSPSDPFDETLDDAPRLDEIADNLPLPLAASEPKSAPERRPSRPRRAPRPIRAADGVVYALLIVIIGIGAWLRFDAQNWDDFTHLHPDERFLTSVVESLGSPLRITGKDPTQADQFDGWGNLVVKGQQHLRCDQRYPLSPDESELPERQRFQGQGGYFDAECSPLNPNNVGHGLYVYGEFPLFTVHLAGVARSHLSQDYHTFLETFDPDAAQEHRITTHWEGYSGVQFIGRSMSALADTLTILIVFLLGRRLYGRWPGLMAAALYAFAAFPIQQSHFWTVDAFTTFWVTLALYFAARVADNAAAIQGPRTLVYLGVWAGGVIWEAAYWERPALGAASLGAIFLGTLALAAGVRLVLERRGLHDLGGLAVAASGVIASVIYLIAWTVADSTAARDFPLYDGLMSLGLASLLYALVALVTYAVAGSIKALASGQETARRGYAALGAVIVLWGALMAGVLIDGLAPWPALAVALATVALMVFDTMDLTDYALFGAAVGAAVASRINVAPLAGIIVVAAGLRALPALDLHLSRGQRSRIIAYTMTGLLVAGLLAFIAFRLLQPHAFLGPDIWGLKFNPNWRDDMSEAAYLTSGDWDAPPNHQWTGRTPYLFPWRNIVLWGLGIPLGLTAWAAWAWAGITILRGRANWTRHLILFTWVLVCFGWLGGRWVTTMRYFMPIYPALALFGAWGLWALLKSLAPSLTPNPSPLHGEGLQRRSTPPLYVAGRGQGGEARRRVGFTIAALITILVFAYTVLYGFGFHNMQRRQLTRVAASRWFQETVPGDFGLWVEGEDGTRQLINIGRGYNAQPPTVTHLEQGAAVTFSCLQDDAGNCLTDAVGQPVPLAVAADARLTRLILQRIGDPARDPDPETIRVRLFREDLSLGRQLVYEGEVSADLSESESPYGTEFALVPDEEIILEAPSDPNLPPLSYSLELTVVEGGPVMFVHDVSDSGGTVLSDVSIGLQMVEDRTLSFIDLKLDGDPLLTGHGDDVPSAPTHYAPGSTDSVQFTIPMDGVIRELEIPHLGDPLRDADEEMVRFTLIGPDGQTVSASVSADFSEGDDPLGQPRTVIFDPPLVVHKSATQVATLTVEPLDPIFTSGPVIAWEGDWDDPVPWPTCPLPDDLTYRDDLPSGLSDYTCQAVNMFDGRYYQGLKLWMVAEDNDDKFQAMTNALDQADYIVITSNRFYDSLTRIPMRWPMTKAYYEALFDGRLGFELVRTFESYPHIGPFEIPDQILPTDDLPDWLNEHWEAEEAFHVYDHPVVFVFQKTADYSPENTRAVLNSVSRKSFTGGVTGDPVKDAQPVGLVPWGAKTASQAPTMLMLPDDKREIQREGGTWSRLFDLDALVNRSQVAAVIVWWLVTVLVGWITFPLLFSIFPGLPDRGFPAAKLAGWLIVAWAAWAGGTFNILTWTRPGLLILVLLLALFSGLIVWRRRAAFWLYLRANRRHLLAVEGLTLILFLAFLGVRLGNPDLWHVAFGGEKPMDFAYFNGVLRSTVFPPLDPWYAGGYLNYYYFGYVLVGAPVKLIGIQPSVAYNLILPTLYAMTGIGVFSIAYNWVRARYVAPGQAAAPPRDTAANADSVGAIHESPLHRPSPEPRAPAGSAWLAGVLALLLAVVLGNLGTLHVIGTGLAKLGGYESKPALQQVRRYELEQDRAAIYDRFYQEELERFRDDHDGRSPSTPDENLEVTQAAQTRADEYIKAAAKHAPVWEIWEHHLSNLRGQLAAMVKGLEQVQNGAPFPPAGSSRWYWEPTRLISELRPLLIGDTRPLADGERNDPVYGYPGHNAITEMPYFTFLYGDLHAHMIAMPITLLVLLWLLAEILGAGYALRAWWEAGLALGLGALAVGVLRPTNSWDWITYLILSVVGLTYTAWLGAARANRDAAPSPGARRLVRWLMPDRWVRLWPVVFVIPLAAAARVAYYFMRKMQAEAQLRRPLQVGEELIDPTLTASSVVVWIAAGLALAVFAYLGLLILLRARIGKTVVVAWIGRVAGFLALSMVAALPFTMYFATAYTKIKPWEEDTTPLWAYLYIHGTFIFIVISLLVWQTARWLRRVRVRDLEGLAFPVMLVVAVLVAILLGAVVFGVREVAIAQLVVPLIVWATLLFLLPGQSPLLRVLYALIVLALGISLGVELVVLEGDIGRQNTVFKFYLQVWFLLSVTGGVALAWLLRASARWHLLLRGAWQTALTILLSVGLLYPVLATQARFLDRFNKAGTPLTLDGMEYMNHSLHGDYGLSFRLESDYNLIRWLQEHVEGTPVVMEAHLFGQSEYRWGGRINIYTGFPTVLGWRWHQVQQRTLPNLGQLVDARANDVQTFYSQPTLPAAERSAADLAREEYDAIRAAWTLIEAYDVEYIVVGPLERAVYQDIALDPVTARYTAGHSRGLAKFDTMVEMGLLEVVYEAPNCVDVNIEIEDCPAEAVYMDRIYHVVPGADLDGAAVAGIAGG